MGYQIIMFQTPLISLYTIFLNIVINIKRKPHNIKNIVHGKQLHALKQIHLVQKYPICQTNLIEIIRLAFN